MMDLVLDALRAAPAAFEVDAAKRSTAITTTSSASTTTARTSGSRAKARSARARASSASSRAAWARELHRARQGLGRELPFLRARRRPADEPHARRRSSSPPRDLAKQTAGVVCRKDKRRARRDPRRLQGHRRGDGEPARPRRGRAHAEAGALREGLTRRNPWQEPQFLRADPDRGRLREPSACLRPAGAEQAHRARLLRQGAQQEGFRRRGAALRAPLHPAQSERARRDRGLSGFVSSSRTSFRTRAAIQAHLRRGRYVIVHVHAVREPGTRGAPSSTSSGSRTARSSSTGTWCSRSPESLPTTTACFKEAHGLRKPAPPLAACRGAGAAFSRAAARCGAPTPEDVEGPFYKAGAPVRARSPRRARGPSGCCCAAS